MTNQKTSQRFIYSSLASIIGSLFLNAQGYAQTDTEDATAQDEEKIVVVGRRVSQTDIAIGQDAATNTVAVTRDELLSAPSGISGLKMLESLPGFNVQTDGALGLYEFGNSVQVRAFDLSQMGFVLDGIPMGRSDAFGGSPIFRYVDNENLGAVIASPGAGDVSKPSYASLGPIATYETVKPSEEMGGMAAISVGDYDLQRTFVKLETGDINGFRAYVSRSKTDSDLWRGPGSIDREHIEAKALYEFGDSYIQATYVANDFFDYDSPSAAPEAFDDNYYLSYSPSIPEGCISPQPGVYDYNGDGVADGNDFTPVFTGSCTNYYEDRINIRDDKLYSLGFGTYLTEDIQFEATAYYEDKVGTGVSPDSYSNSLAIYERQAAAGLDVVHPRGVQYGLSGMDGERKGIVAGFDWFAGDHHFAVGGWVEEDTYHRIQQRTNKVGGSSDGEALLDEIAYYRRDYVAVRDTTQLYLKDDWTLMDGDLIVTLGAKALQVDYSLDGYRDYADYEVNSEPGYGPQSVGHDYEKNFMPMVGAVYSLNNSDQVFASFAKNAALPNGTDDIFSTAVSFAAPAPAMEEASNYEMGIRTNRENYNGSIALFYTEFDNRLIASSVINPATEQPESFYINAGASDAYGIEISGVYQPEIFNRELYFSGNLSYKKATLKDGFDGNPDGALLPDSPEWLATAGVTYEPTEWLVANFSAKYTDKRYLDFAETYSLDSYIVAQAYVDIGGPNNFGLPENVRLRFNLDNVFDKQVVSFGYVGSNYGRPLSPRTFQATLTVDF